ncbi:hypothetical protein V6574_16300 [Streptomyces sp. SM1P]
MAQLTFCAHCMVMAPLAPVVIEPSGATMSLAAVMPTPTDWPGV